MPEPENRPISSEDYIEQGQHKLATQQLNAAALQQDTDRLVTAAKAAGVDTVELADRLRQKSGLTGSMEGIYEQVVAFGTLHKRTFNWNHCTFYMTAQHAQVIAGNGTPEKNPPDVVSVGGSSSASGSPNDKGVHADIEKMRQEMEDMKLVMEQQLKTIQELRASKAVPQLRQAIFVLEAGHEMEANEANLPGRERWQGRWQAGRRKICKACWSLSTRRA